VNCIKFYWKLISNSELFDSSKFITKYSDRKKISLELFAQPNPLREADYQNCI